MAGSATLYIKDLLGSCSNNTYACDCGRGWGTSAAAISNGPSAAITITVFWTSSDSTLSAAISSGATVYCQSSGEAHLLTIDPNDDEGSSGTDTPCDDCGSNGLLEAGATWVWDAAGNRAV